MLLQITQQGGSGKISSVIQFTITTTDSTGAPVNPYSVDNVTIYFIERNHLANENKELPVTIQATSVNNFFSQAVPSLILGVPLCPAWLSGDSASAMINQQDFDSEGNPLIGTFQFIWKPGDSGAQEGDYLICWTWTPIMAGDQLSNSFGFFLLGDTKETTCIPTHRTPPRKYETLLERYTPEMFKLTLTPTDLTPDIINRTNQAVAQGFTVLEDLGNPIIDLQNANSTPDFLLPYLANLFNWRLKSTDLTLWRRQIKQAVPLYKQKGTLQALTAAFAEAGMTLLDYTQYWQVVSSCTWQDGFVIGEEILLFFTLSELAILPPDGLNFDVYIRFAGTDTYVQLTLDYVIFNNVNNQTIVTWNGDNLSINPISLQTDDVVLITYLVADCGMQSVEDYIRTLPLADTRDPLTVTYPLKNWNVRLIADNDPMFDVVCPTRHPFHDPVVFGQIRTEFPYSENIYNMDEWNGSLRNSTIPCDIDKSFMDSCSCCFSSSYSVDLEIVNLTPDRISEAQDILTDFVPFHAVLQNINYVGAIQDFILSPLEQIDILVQCNIYDHVLLTQFDFNRIIENGASDAGELNRSMLANLNTILTTSGTGANIAVDLFSPSVIFGDLGVGANNLLEILAGTNEGQYQVALSQYQHETIDIQSASPDTIPYPLDTSQFPFRLSNQLYTQLGCSIYQNNVFAFSDPNNNFVFIGTEIGWSIYITSGIYTGVYSITSVNTNGSLDIQGFPAPVNVSNLPYQLLNPSNAVILQSMTGQVATTQLGMLEIDAGVSAELGIQQTDYVLYNGVQYLVDYIELTPGSDNLYLDSYALGTVVGLANITIYRRLLDNALGYVGLTGMQVTGAVPDVDYTLENNMFLESYLLLINSNYYSISNISGSVMTINGPMNTWGVAGVPITYSIIQLVKTSPITAQDGQEFQFLDRRGNDAITITIEEQPAMMPMMFQANVLNDMNKKQGNWMDSVSTKEEIKIDIQYRQ